MSNSNKPHNKRSYRAKMVARDYIENTVKGGKKTLKEIAINRGYSESSSTHGSVTRTKSYKEEIAPILAQYDRILAKIRDSMEAKDTDNERLLDLSNIAKNVLHDKQLLGGRSTENIAYKPQIIIYGPEDPLSKMLNKKTQD